MHKSPEKFNIEFTLTSSTGFNDELEVSLSVKNLETDKKYSLEEYKNIQSLIEDNTFSAEHIEGLDLSSLDDEYEYEGTGTIEIEHHFSYSYYDGEDYDATLNLTVICLEKKNKINDDWCPTENERRTFKTLNESNDYEQIKLRVLSPEKMFVSLRYAYTTHRSVLPTKEFIRAIAWFLNTNEEDRTQLLIKSKLKI
jgi:hypothetical protein